MKVMLLLSAFLVFTSAEVAGQNLSCSSAVTLNGGTIEVASVSSGDDTENLQCALDFAVEAGFRDIFLSSSDYVIGGVSGRGFQGDVRGRSKGATLVTVQNGSLNCSEAIGTAMEFQVGNVSVRNMTISVDSPCADGNAASVIAFYSNADNCEARTVFGNVDRVVINGSGTQG